MSHSFHCHLRKSFNWYNQWHNHPHHHHIHWSLFLVFASIVTLFLFGQIGQFYSENSYFNSVNTAHAQTANLGISGSRFTLNGVEKFLVLAGYFDGLDSPNLTSDLDFLKSKGIDGIRIFPNWWATVDPSPVHGFTLMNMDGSLDSSRLNDLRRVVSEAQGRNMIVDVSFARETVPGPCSQGGRTMMCVPEYKNGVVAAVQALSVYSNIFYDLQNEFDGGVTFLSDSDVADLRDRIRSAVPGAFLSVSSGDASASVRLGMNITNIHDTTQTNANNTANIVSSALANGGGRPVHFGEPYHSRSVRDGLISSSELARFMTEAKRGGAATIVYHNRVGFILDSASLESQISQVELDFLNSFRSQVDATGWGTGGSATCSNPPCGDQGFCPAGYIMLAEANASGADTASNGFFCDNDHSTGIPQPVIGATYPVQGILVCDPANANGTAFVSTDSSRCQTWSFDSSGPTGVNFISTYQCAGGQSASFTVDSGNLAAGAWTTSPAVAGAVCIPGTDIPPPSITPIPSITPTPAPAIIPTLTSASPDSATEGATVTLTGTKFDQCDPVHIPTACNVQFFDFRGNRSTVNGMVNSPTSLTAIVPTGDLCSGFGSIRIGSIQNPSNPLLFEIISGTGTNCTGSIYPASTDRYLYFIAPSRAPILTTLLLSGDNITSTVYFDLNGTITTLNGIINNENTEITLRLPSTLAPGIYNVRSGPTLTDVSNNIEFEVSSGLPAFEPLGTEPPIITGFNPTTISQGGTLEIYGEFLPPTVQFSGNGQTYNVLGWTSSDFTTVTVGIPSTLQPGLYTVGVNGANGSTTATGTLTITANNPAIINQPPPEPSAASGKEIGALISSLFDYAVMILGVAIFIMFMWAGFLWMTSGANPGNIAKAKTMMFNAIIGAVLLVSSYAILYTINPELIGSGFELPGITGGGGGGGGGGGNQFNACTSCNAYPGNTTSSYQQRLQCVGNYINLTQGTNINLNSTASTCPYGISEMRTRLVLLKSITDPIGISWVISEGFPPTIDHTSIGHTNGQSVDIRLSGSANATQIDQLCIAAKQANFTRVLNEYGITTANCGNPISNGNHIHLDL